MEGLNLSGFFLPFMSLLVRFTPIFVLETIDTESEDKSKNFNLSPVQVVRENSPVGTPVPMSTFLGLMHMDT